MKHHQGTIWFGVEHVALFAALLMADCVSGETLSQADEIEPGCLLRGTQLPVQGAASVQTYAGRGFYVDGNHLGWDVRLPDGQAVRPVGCGVVRLARSARGYGTLAVVIEHRLGNGLTVQNGNGQHVFVDRFLSIYGHLRPTSERNGRGVERVLRVGDQVTPETIIGYVENGALNGDGAEHLHLGIRLQSMAAAIEADPSAWFRGYDASPSQRRWFADPERFLAALRDGPTSVPVGATDSGVSASLDVGPGPVLPASDVPAAPGPVESPRLFRYEFRVRSALRVGPPYRLRDEWWRPVACRNTGTFEPSVMADGWVRCDTERLGRFDGSVFIPDRTDWGDQGQVGTVGNAPARCTFLAGAEWRITLSATETVAYAGPVTGLACEPVGSQDRLVFPSGW